MLWRLQCPKGWFNTACWIQMASEAHVHCKHISSRVRITIRKVVICEKYYKEEIENCSSWKSIAMHISFHMKCHHKRSSTYTSASLLRSRGRLRKRYNRYPVLFAFTFRFYQFLDIVGLYIFRCTQLPIPRYCKSVYFLIHATYTQAYTIITGVKMFNVIQIHFCIWDVITQTDGL